METTNPESFIHFVIFSSFFCMSIFSCEGILLITLIAITNKINKIYQGPTTNDWCEISHTKYKNHLHVWLIASSTYFKLYLWSLVTADQLRHDDFGMEIQWTFNLPIKFSQWLAWRLATGKVPGSNPGNGENLLFSDERKFN